MPESRFDDDYAVFRCTREEPEHTIHRAEVRGIDTKWVDPWIGRNPAVEVEPETLPGEPQAIEDTCAAKHSQWTVGHEHAKVTEYCTKRIGHEEPHYYERVPEVLAGAFEMLMKARRKPETV